MADLALAGVLSDAALQALFMRSRRRDIAREAEGWTFYYGVDANVVRLWGNPRNAGAGPTRQIGQIFRGDGSALATAISWGLLTYIFEVLGDARPPLIIVPPIEIEVARVLEALNSTDHLSPSAQVRRRIAETVTLIRSQVSVDQLGDLNVRLQELLFEEIGERSELRRILLLFSKERVARLEDAARFLPSNVRDMVLPENIIGAWAKYAYHRVGTAQKEGWIDRLRRVGNWKSEELLFNDASVLARLQEWNRRLAKDRTTKARFLYLTTDYRLFRAASELSIEDDDRSTNFADAYLRHPRAYLSESGVLGPLEDAQGADAAAKPETVGDWLTLLTQPAGATFTDLLDTPRSRLETPVVIQRFAEQMANDRSHKSDAAERLAPDLLEKWKNFAEDALATHPASQDSVMGLTDDLKRPVIAVRAALLDAMDRLEINYRETLRQYLTVTTQLGREFEANQDDRQALRAVPPIFFEGWPDAGDAVAAMSRWTGDIDDARYAAATTQFDKDDASHYAFYLGNAVFFAARGRWKAAALVVRRARGIAETEKSKADREGRQTHVNGREAAFFDAVCRRNLAADSGALVGAYDSLDAAQAILDAETQAGEFDEFVAERFAIERAMIDLAQYQIASLAAPSAAVDDDVETLRDIADRLWHQLVEVADQLSDPGGPSQAAAATKPGSADHTRRQIESQLLFTILGLGFLPDAASVDATRAVEALDRLDAMVVSTSIDGRQIGQLDLATLLAARLRRRIGEKSRSLRQSFDHLVRQLDQKRDQLLSYEGAVLDRLVSTSRTPWPRG